jgi:hypothetical protein
MKAPEMTLTTEDLSAIKLMMEEVVDHKIDSAIDNLSVQIVEGFNEVSENFIEVRSDIAELKSDVAELKTDVAELKIDVRLLKIDMVEVKTDVAELKLDMREVKWGLADTVRRAEFLDVRDRVTRLEHRRESN